MKLKLIDKKNEAKDTMSFVWEPEDDVNYLPGQYFYFTLPKLSKPDNKGATRHLTISSSPTEGPYIMCTTRIRDESGYKQTLKDLETGTEIEGSGPEGTFVLDENEKGPHVLLAGGVGATPFRTFLKYALDKETNQDFYILTSNSKKNEEIYASEFEKWSEHKNISYFHTFSQERVEDAFEGRVELDMIKNCVPKKVLASAAFWVSGPPTYVNAVRKILVDSPFSKNIRVESFDGY